MCGDKIESIKENWVGWQCTLFLSNEIIWSLTFLAQNKIASFLWHKFLDNSMCDVPKSWEFRKFRIWCYVVLVRVSNFVAYCCLPMAIFVIWIVPKSGFMFMGHSVACQTHVVDLEFEVLGMIRWVHYLVLVNKPNKRFQSLLCLGYIQHDCWKHKAGNSRFCFKQLALFLLDTLLRLVILNFFVLSCFSIFQQSWII